ncbi:aminoglycoside phosphotransferase family protein [Saccharomonospora sp. NB11]|uniref:aminoglycoside phosphotransferase family protein n=1 Tax=Saccharomonospora sp. NB11 TaxID=1642298 RepID=UPI0018D09F6D|nr:aminoglycoside phosphotransferase family protein [Saccharomonospora sp. NB11]
METRPENFDEEDLSAGLAEHFGVVVHTTSYAPVGFGDYHWHVTDGDGRQWFAKVSDLTHKEHCGPTPETAFVGLRKAMETATTLHERDGLDFVVAPRRSRSGPPVIAWDDQYALSLFPLIPGEAGDFYQELPSVERDQVLGLLARLHRSAPPECTPATVLDPPGRADLENTLTELSTSWTGGPFAEPARELAVSEAELFRTRLADFDRLADQVRRDGRPQVVTHGEPHPGNLLRAANGYLLIDWDTVGLAVPERDLSLLSDDPTALGRYAELAGTDPDLAALALYRLRWSLTDLAEFLAWFRSPHTRTTDTDMAWKGLTDTVENLRTFTAP